MVSSKGWSVAGVSCCHDCSICYGWVVKGDECKSFGDGQVQYRGDERAW